jgi:hypothetical protein
MDILRKKAKDAARGEEWLEAKADKMVHYL